MSNLFLEEKRASRGQREEDWDVKLPNQKETESLAAFSSADPQNSVARRTRAGIRRAEKKKSEEQESKTN